MDKLNRARRLHTLLQLLPELPVPETGLYFGEHVIRVSGQLCLVVTLKGQVGIRATDSELETQLQRICAEDHWIAHGRVYEQWYLLPDTVDHNSDQVAAWVRQAALGAARLAEDEQRPAKAGRLR
ncbi:hypothetical protein [Saccharospirillum impatiens]|uniref:hypothetical protein n=1 Tax=Saccharospirillum impatiens TaxID=169438 RepID=UPI0003FBD94A|nr:hypothetical protein [Saccharospirillum impatiens]